MPATTRGRLAALCLAVLPATAAPARADFFRDLCHKGTCHKGGCETQRVTLPAREIEVTTEQPRVTVRESTRLRTRAEAAPLPVVGTVYMPMTMAMPMAAAVPAVGATTREECTVRAANPFEAAHRAEVAMFHADMARAELQRTIEAQNRVLQRFSDSSKCDNNNNNGGTDLVKKVDQLAADVQKMNTRLTDVEKLLIFHDNYIQKKILPPPTPMNP